MIYYSTPGFRTFNLFSILFTLVFLMVFATFAVTLIRGIVQWSRNNHAPKLTVPAVIVAKRTHVFRRHGANGHHHRSTAYYVTFQVESGDRMELQMSGPEYGLLVEGDRGNLSFQGTRYLGFARL